MRLHRETTINNQKGFTIVELMVVLAILGIALAAIFQFFFFTQTSYARADARSEVIQETDLLFLQLEKDIRSASEPNSVTKSVCVLDNGQGLDIYSYKDVLSNGNTVRHYYRTSYRINGTELQRGHISTTSPSNSANPQYNTITNWQTLVTNLAPGNTMIFDDSRNIDVSVRRLIDVNVYVQHPGLNNNVHVQTAIMSRTGKSTSSIEAYNANYSYKKVAYIKFYQDGKEITTLNIGKSGGAINITARAFAEDGTIATNQNLQLQQNFSSTLWAAFPGYSFLSGDDLIEVINKLDLNLDGYRDRYVVRSGQSFVLNTDNYPWIWHIVLGDTRTARIKAVSPDGIEATLIMKQNY